MGLGYWDYLSFKEIADKWSEEQAVRPNAFTSGEILQELVSSMILGDFDDNTGASRVEFFMPVNDGANEEAWQPFTRQDFLGAIACLASTDKEDKNRVIVLDGIEFPPEVLKPEDRLYACGTPLKATKQEKSEWKFQIPDPLPWKEAKTKVPWEKLATVPLDRYPELVQAAYLKNFRISFNTFADWCTHRKLEQPSFWRGPLVASTEKKPQPDQSRYEKWADCQRKLITDGEAETLREAAKLIAAKENVDYSYVERETRRTRREREKSGEN